MIKDIHLLIKMRRSVHWMTIAEAAETFGISTQEYRLIEKYEEDIATRVPIGTVKKIFDFYGLDFFNMLELECAFCNLEKRYRPEYQLPRNELVRFLRLELKMDEEDLADKIGIYDDAFEWLEGDPDFLENEHVNDIYDLAGILYVPPQLLFGVKCLDCHR